MLLPKHTPGPHHEKANPIRVIAVLCHTAADWPSALLYIANCDVVHALGSHIRETADTILLFRPPPG
jgi:hypothetical protein